MFKVLVKNSNSNTEISKIFGTCEMAFQWISKIKMRLGEQFTYEIVEESMYDCDLTTIKKHWEVGNLDSGEIAWLIKRAEIVENPSRDELIECARATVSLITSYTKDSAWAREWGVMYEIFQENADRLNDALDAHRFDWDKELKKQEED